MAEDTTATETTEGVEQASAGDVNLDLQDRMSEGAEDAWYSSSNGKMFSGEDELVHPVTGEPFRSKADYDKFVAESKVQQNAEAKTGIVAKEPPKPMSRSFDSIVAGESGQINAERIFQLSKANDAYSYKNELVPTIDQSLQQQAVEEKTPVQLAQEYKAERVKSIADPMVALRDAMRDELVAQGADATLASQLVSRIADDIYKKQLATIETDFQARQTEAIAKMAELKAKSVIDPIEKQQLTTKSTANIERLAKAYYPDGGPDAFFSLVNGYNDEKGNFQRGPASSVIDLLMSVAAGDKKFANESQRNEFYANQFQKMTANPVMAQSLFDIAHNYWLGRNVKTAYSSGKSTGLKEARESQKHVKPRPTASQNGVATDRDEGLGPMMRAFLGDK